MGALKVYDADQVTFIFAAIPIDSGYADGEFIRITKTNPDFTTKEGTDGQVTRSKTNSGHHVIKLTLMQSSSGNALLSALRNIDLAASNGAGVGPILIRDRSGTSLYAASKAWIAAPPEVVFSREAEAREWTIECADFARLDGGN